MDSTAEPDHDAGDFVAALLASQRGIHAFLVALLPCDPDLDDVFQQVCLALWQERGKYDATRPFLPWAYGFARNVVHSHIRNKSRRGVRFDGELIDAIAIAREADEPQADARRAALDDCIKRLPPSQRELLVARYERPESLKEIAATRNISPAALTMRLQRIRHTLLRCVEQALAAGGMG